MNNSSEERHECYVKSEGGLRKSKGTRALEARNLKASWEESHAP